MHTTDYEKINTMLKSLIENHPKDIFNTVANLSNAAALLWSEMQGINWAGFYLASGETLYLGPFQGKIACREIAFSRGVCGAAATGKKTVLVENVHEFPGHIACDCASMSEIVIPVFADGRLFGVLDIDSPLIGRFSKADQDGLEKFVKTLESTLSQTVPA